MRIFITGIAGQLGDALKNAALNSGHVVLGCGRKELTDNNYISMDLSNPDCISHIINYKPDVIIHCAAYTNVDAAEEIQNQNEVFYSNVVATENVTHAAKLLNCKLIYISTDYVFNYDFTECKYLTNITVPNPANYYGFTKYLSEQIVEKYLKSYIVRISWLYGKNHNNFVNTIRKLLKRNIELTVVNDQIGRLTNADDLSLLLLSMANTDKYGKYNVSNSGDFVSLYDIAVEIAKNNNLIKPVTTEEYNKVHNIHTIRPKNSRFQDFDNFELLPDWKKSLNNFLNET